MKCFDFKNCYSLLRKKEYSAKKVFLLSLPDTSNGALITLSLKMEINLSGNDLLPASPLPFGDAGRDGGHVLVRGDSENGTSGLVRLCTQQALCKQHKKGSEHNAMVN